MIPLVSEDLMPEDFSPEPPYSVENPPLSFRGRSHQPSIKTSTFNVGGDFGPHLAFFDDPAVVADDQPRRPGILDESIWHAYFLLHDRPVPELVHSLIELDAGTKVHDVFRATHRSSRLNSYFRSLVDGIAHGYFVSENIRHSLRNLLTLSVANGYVQTLAALQEVDDAEFEGQIRAILSETLLERGFHTSEKYEDGFGAIVSDFFRGEDRVSCVISDASMQLLAYIDGRFFERTLERGPKARFEVTEVAESFFDESPSEST